MENLCNECMRICGARNTDRTITVISCTCYICDYTQIERTEIQSKLC
jgi:hypothetical protein